MANKNTKPFEFRLGKPGLAILVVGLTALVFAAFLFGIHVGRDIDTYPEMIAKTLPLKLADAMGLLPGPKPPPRLAEEKDVMEAAAAATAAAAKEGEGQAAPAPGATPEVPTPAVTPPTIPAGPPSASAVPAAPPSAPAPETSAAQPPKEADKTAKAGRYLVQVVSLQDKAKAEAAAKKVKAAGYKPVLSVTEIPGKGKWHRVTVEGLASKAAAEKVAAALTQKIKGVRCVVRTRDEKKP